MIFSLDECWLDGEANTVDEQHVLDTLESALDLMLQETNRNVRVFYTHGKQITDNSCQGSTDKKRT
jgi:hypothetical protein